MTERSPGFYRLLDESGDLMIGCMRFIFGQEFWVVLRPTGEVVRGGIPKGRIARIEWSDDG